VCGIGNKREGKSGGVAILTHFKKWGAGEGFFIVFYFTLSIDKTRVIWYNKACDGRLRNRRLAMSRSMLRTVLHSERGQGLTEYAMVLSIVSIAAVATVTLFGDIIVNTFYRMINDAFPGG